MRKIGLLGVVVLAGCVSTSQPLNVVEQDERGTYVRHKIGDEAFAGSVMVTHCGGEPVIPLIGQSLPVRNARKTYFSCIDASQYGQTNATTAVPWSDASAGRGAYISCPVSLDHCYKRASVMCESGYTVAQQSMRGAVAVSPGNVSNTSVNVGDTAVAVGTNAYANTANPSGQVYYDASQTMNAYAQGAAIAAQRRALAQNQAALDEATKEYGKLWVMCTGDQD